MLKTLKLATAIIVMWSSAQAQMACGLRDAMVSQLGDRYGEVRKGAGLAGPTAIIEVWASDASGTWTIMETTADGLTCVLAAGDNWIDDLPVFVGKGS